MIPDTWLQRASNTAAEGQSQGKISTNAPKTQCQSNLSYFHFDTIHRNSLAV